MTDEGEGKHLPGSCGLWAHSYCSALLAGKGMKALALQCMSQSQPPKVDLKWRSRDGPRQLWRTDIAHHWCKGTAAQKPLNADQSARSVPYLLIDTCIGLQFGEDLRDRVERLIMPQVVHAVEPLHGELRERLS